MSVHDCPLGPLEEATLIWEVTEQPKCFQGSMVELCTRQDSCGPSHPTPWHRLAATPAPIWL